MISNTCPHSAVPKMWPVESKTRLPVGWPPSLPPVKMWRTFSFHPPPDAGKSCKADGAAPWTNLILDAAGNLYGTTTLGGNLACIGPGGICIAIQ